MLWLTWRQFRASAALVAGALAVLAALLALSGPELADEYADGFAACSGQGEGCEGFFQGFFHDYHTPFLTVTAIALVLPALIGMFWGAPLIARELEAGTHRLVWNQGITRGRWLGVKLGVVGLAAMAAAGLGSLAITWWADPLDASAAGDYPRMGPLVFAARGIVPVAYAAFAFALGVTLGLLVRRTVAAMALTLAVFVALQVAIPLLVREHYVAPATADVAVSTANLDGIGMPRDGGDLEMKLESPSTSTESGRFADAWILSADTVDGSGRVIAKIPIDRTGPCAPREGAPPTRDSLDPCFAEVERLGYHQRVTYQPSDRFWTFQAAESAIYAGLAGLLAGFCFWRLRRRAS
jgi:hypothetical protein